MHHHAFVIEAGAEKGISVAQAWAEKELGMKTEGNPDFVVMRYGLFSVADARIVSELAAGAAFAGESKVVVIAVSRVYHEAQNALLKVFEEPPAGTYIFFILPSLGGLLPTLRSRVQILNSRVDTKCPPSEGGHLVSTLSEATMEFLNGTKERRSTIIKRLTSGKDDEKKRELRDEAIALVNGIEAVAYKYRSQTSILEHGELLSDVATLRTYLYDRSAPVKMILEHIALVIPKDLL